MRRSILNAIATAIVCVASAAQASTPTFWQISSQSELLRGEIENLSIDSDGRVVLGPETDLVAETTAPFLWSIVRDEDGTLYAGSGNEGNVYRIAPGSDEATVLFDAPELEVHALALAPDGALYVATSPEGRIYKVGRDGASSVFFDPGDRYIWTLAVDQAGNVYAGAGDKGIVYRITPDGEGEPFYDTKASHVTALAFDRDGNVLAGTESPGRIYRIGADRKAFVLLDSAFREIHAIRMDRSGTLYAVAVSARPGAAERPADRPPAEPPRTPVPSVSTEITAIAIVDVQPATTASGGSTSGRRDDRGGPKGAIYRISPDGLWDVAWESTEDTPYDVMFAEDGALIVGTGSDGKIFRVSGEPATTTLLTSAPAQQVTMFLTEDDTSYYATANPGKVYRLASARADRGTYESPVRDATTVATWGSLRWRATLPAGTEVQLFTRSGNTATPDETWSDWSGPYTISEREQIKSPNARYLQWRAVLTGKTASPILTSVTAAYLERNLRPQVATITVHPPGVVFQRPFSTGDPEIAGYEQTAPADRNRDGSGSGGASPALGRRLYQRGLQTFVWKAEDPNGDLLQYDVLYREEGDTAWTVLKRALFDPIFVWDTSSVPDGTYIIKIAASDAPSNSPGSALVGELESTSFDVDNTPPTIEISEVRRETGRTLVNFRVTDRHSPVQRVEYSLDANRWRVVYPKDGIPDSRTEVFELVVEGEGSPREVILRATDAMSNASTAVASTQVTRSP